MILHLNNKTKIFTLSLGLRHDRGLPNKRGGGMRMRLTISCSSFLSLGISIGLVAGFLWYFFTFRLIVSREKYKLFFPFASGL